MARPKSPCGTYPAYQRHLRNGEPVDPACRRAQREHDGRRSAAQRRRDVETPAAAPVVLPGARLAELRGLQDGMRAGFLEHLRRVTAAVEDDDVYGVIDLTGELDGLLDAWLEVRDEIEYERGYPELDEPLRSTLLAAGRELYGH